MNLTRLKASSSSTVMDNRMAAAIIPVATLGFSLRRAMPPITVTAMAKTKENVSVMADAAVTRVKIE